MVSHSIEGRGADPQAAAPPAADPTAADPPHASLAPRRIHGINWIGARTLYFKEVQRFTKVATQTVAAPMVTALLMLAIFTLALGEGRETGGVPFVSFLAPGLVMMSITQNAFANTSSSLMISKVQGNIVDMLMPPLSAGEFLTCYALAGVTRGLVVAVAVAAVMTLFVPVQVADPVALIYFPIAGALMMSLIGIAAGLWADKFDQLAAVTNFVVTPLAFLSGTFYSIDRLPGIWYTLSHLNPFFYMIDGFRGGVIGYHDAPAWQGMLVLAAADILLWGLCYLLIRRGYKLKA
ncbi:ABC transporter permease [Marinibaculum pumilum]|uniref:Transport permease protein n=1 Tax=Marinibaculum pumilum TaxID=1766165 RepID=A0ABV7L7H4_9PROT